MRNLHFHKRLFLPKNCSWTQINADLQREICKPCNFMGKRFLATLEMDSFVSFRSNTTWLLLNIFSAYFELVFNLTIIIIHFIIKNDLKESLC